jgi:RHS repeat-associated protein
LFISGLNVLTFPDTVVAGQSYSLNGVSQASQSHTYGFNSSSTFSATVAVTAKDRAGNQGSSPLIISRDTLPPLMTMSVPAQAPLRSTLTWGGVDALSGVRDYSVEVSANGGLSWTPLVSAGPVTETIFVGTPGESYHFRVKATDNVNNESTWVEVGPMAIVAVTKYYTFNGQRVAMRQGDDVYYLHGDHLGSTSLTTDDSGTVVSEVRYHPYGQERWVNGEAVTDFGFTAQRNEASFGLMDYNARYYSPRLGRFISPDSIVPEPGSSSGFNRYRYTRNNPLKYTDPSGHCAEFGDDACWSEYERIKFVDKCEDCETILTNDGLVPLHEANYNRLRTYRENRIVNPVEYEVPAILDAYATMINEPSDVIILGANAGFISPGGTGQGPTIGAEAVINRETGETSIFSYEGAMTGPGIGGSLNSYVGFGWNVESNLDYTGDFESITVTGSFGKGGAVTIFWAPDFTADKPFGFSVGPASGIEFSAVHSSTYYWEHLTNRN